MHQQARFMSDNSVDNRKPGKAASGQDEPQIPQPAQDEDKEWEMVEAHKEDDRYVHVYKRKKSKKEAASPPDQAGESSTNASSGKGE